MIAAGSGASGGSSGGKQRLNFNPLQPEGVNNLWLAMSKFRRGKMEECIKLCDLILSENPRDEAAWFLKCKALTKQAYMDDIELDEEGIAEMLLDENAISQVARPGTSLNTPQVGNKSGGFDQGIRPMSQSGRPLTGFSRPQSSRPMSGATNIRDALQSRQGGASARPMTTMGREVRLGTASMVSNNGQFVDIPKFMAGSKKNIEKFKIALTEYSLHVEHNVKQALEICAEGTKAQNFENWWWKARLGKCYYKLGLLREAEQQFKSSLRNQPIINTYLELCNVYMRLDLPSTALAILAEGAEKFNREPRLLLGIARIHDMLNNPEEANTYYNMVLGLDAGNVEATACLGAHNFYSDRPEVAIRYYRRLLQIGVNSSEVWNNIGLSCFYSSQYDMALNCMERALAIASDDTAADIWYNIGHIAIAIGDLILALQAFKVASAIDPNHGEALNNIAVLEMRKQKLDQKYDYAKSILSNSISVGTHLFEPQYNSALLCFRQGNLQEAFNFVEQALKIYPNHADSKELHDILKKTFSSA